MKLCQESFNYFNHKGQYEAVPIYRIYSQLKWDADLYHLLRPGDAVLTVHTSMQIVGISKHMLNKEYQTTRLYSRYTQPCAMIGVNLVCKQKILPFQSAVHSHFSDIKYKLKHIIYETIMWLIYHKNVNKYALGFIYRNYIYIIKTVPWTIHDMLEIYMLRNRCQW